MSIEENKALVRRFWALTAETLEEVDNLLIEDYRHHDPAFPPDLQAGREHYLQGMHVFWTGFPDLVGTVQDMVAEGDKVASHVVYSGTHDGELMGIPPTGKHADIQIMCIHRIEGDRIAEAWVVYDALGMLQQIGAVPAPQGAAAS